MFDAFFVLGIVLGVVLTMILVIVKFKSKNTNARLEDGIAMFSSAYAVVAGIKVCTVITFNTSIPIDVLTRLYIFIGGAVTVWISFSSIATQFIKVHEKGKMSRKARRS